MLGGPDDRPNRAELEALGIPLSPRIKKEQRIKDIRGVRTGEKRHPKKGEWYLSGGPPMVWRAPNNLNTPFHIMQLVRVEQVVTERIVAEITPDI